MHLGVHIQEVLILLGDNLFEFLDPFLEDLEVVFVLRGSCNRWMEAFGRCLAVVFGPVLDRLDAFGELVQLDFLVHP